MTFRTFFFAGAAAGLLATPVFAITQDMIDSIVSDLSGQGYTRLEIKDYGSSIKVEATGPNGKLERLYSSAGEVVREETNGVHTGGQHGVDDDEDDDNNRAGAGRDDDDDDHRSGSRDDDDDDHDDDDDDDDDDDSSRGRDKGDKSDDD
jgi:phosphopantothenoylcysteine synthetase/decarboxylase